MKISRNQNVNTNNYSDLSLLNFLHEFDVPVIIGQNNVITFVNKKFLKIFGYKTIDHENLKISDIIITDGKNIDSTNNVNQLPVFIINKQKKKVKCVIKGQIKIIKNQIVNLEVMVKVEDTLIINLNKPNSYKSSIRIDLHDLGNIMTIINGNLHLLRTKYQIDDSNEIYNNLIRASNAGTNLIKKMILTNSKSRAEFIIVDLHDIILQAIDLSKWTMEKIKIILDLRAKESKLFGDQNNLLNSIINIIINARDAMSEGGHLYISTSNIYEELIFQRENETVKNNKFIDVRIMDTGTGIEPDIQEFIFDPFFTTKGNGGTGLGLAGVQSTIFKHFGIINLVNSNSNGSEFQIILPLI